MNPVGTSTSSPLGLRRAVAASWDQYRPEPFEVETNPDSSGPPQVAHFSSGMDGSMGPTRGGYLSFSDGGRREFRAGEKTRPPQRPGHAAGVSRHRDYRPTSDIVTRSSGRLWKRQPRRGASRQPRSARATTARAPRGAGSSAAGSAQG